MEAGICMIDKMETELEELSQASATHEYHSSDKSKRWLSYSQLATFLSCEYQWYTRYVTRIQPAVTPRAMSVGDGVHRGIATTLLGKGYKAGLKEWHEDITKLIPIDLLDTETAESFVTMYNDVELITLRLIEDIKERGWRVAVMPNGERAVELELSAPMEGCNDRFDGFAAHIDCILNDPISNTNWIVDWKTRKSFQGDDSESTNLQNAIYQYIAMKNGIEISGTVTYQVSSKPPKSPSLNKNGTMSRTAISTDWKTYKQALEDNGLDPSDYTDMMAKLDKDPVRPIKMYRGAEEIQNVWDQIVMPVANKIMEIDRPVRSMGYMNCLNCGSKSICLSAMRGHDNQMNLIGMSFDEEAVQIAIEKGIL